MDLNLDALVAASAVAAFVVAVFSLYASSLKRGDIELVMISNPAEIKGGSWSVNLQGAMESVSLNWSFYAINEGARSAALEEVKVANFTIYGREPNIDPFALQPQSFFTRRTPLPPGGPAQSDLTMPIGIAPGDTTILYLSAQPQFLGPTASASALHACHALDVEIQWTFARRPSALKSILAKLVNRPHWNVGRKHRQRIFRTTGTPEQMRSLLFRRWHRVLESREPEEVRQALAALEGQVHAESY